MKISVIIVSYNSLKVLKPCLESLERQKLAGETEVIIVDNASADGTPHMVSTEFAWTRLITNTKNVGYSKGVNLGIREASGDYLLILNPDTVVREDSIEKLLEFMEANKDAGIVGPKLVFFDGNIQNSCRRFYNWKVLLLRRTFLGKIFKNSQAVSRHLMLDFDHEHTREVDWLLGAAMFVRREAIESVGLMDERFFLYFEDVDWCYRMKQKGWKVYYHPASIITHGYARESAQSVINRSFISHLVSLIRYYEKWNFILYFLKKYREVSKILLFIAIDVIAFNLAFLAAYYLRVLLQNYFTNPIYSIDAYDQFVWFENLLFVFTYFALGLYRIRRETVCIDELFDIIKAICLASILLMTSTYLGKIRTYSRMVVAFLVPFAIILDWGIRSAVRLFHKRLLSLKIDLKRVCIVGPREAARELEQRLALEESMGIEVVGIVETDDEVHDTFGGSLGAFNDIQHIVDRYRIQEIIFMHEAIPPERITEFISMGRKRVLDITVLTDYSDLVIHQAKVMSFAGRPVIAYQRDTRYAIDVLGKRLLDIVLSAGFIVVSLPFYVLYSLYQLVRGKKPTSFKDGYGLGGKPISIPATGISPGECPSDLVNLPLFLRVLRGEMSMVGPYPLSMDEARLLKTHQKFRYDVRPGVTGYWRMHAGEKTSLDDLLTQDANYIRNWSLILDLKILLATLGKILSGRNSVLRIINHQ